MRKRFLLMTCLAVLSGSLGIEGQTVPSTASSSQSATTTAPATRRGGPAWTGPWGPAVLPGKGLAEHPFLYGGEATSLNLTVVRDGKVAWQYTHPKPKAGPGEISDATMLSNGNILFAFQFGAAIVTPEKKILWSVDSDPGCEIHSAAAMGADRVAIVQNGHPAKLKVFNITSGTTEKDLIIPSGTAQSVHLQFRRIRVTAAGTFLVSHMDLNKVSEYDANGKEIWSVPVNAPWSASRLKNGNTLIASNSNFVREVDAKGATVWELRQMDVPEIRLFNTQTAYRLANGDTIINNWRGPMGTNLPVQFFEVTPDKKVVWAVRSWGVGGGDDVNLGQSTNIQLLDEPGAPEKGEMLR